MGGYRYIFFQGGDMFRSLLLGQTDNYPIVL